MATRNTQIPLSREGRSQALPEHGRVLSGKEHQHPHHLQSTKIQTYLWLWTSISQSVLSKQTPWLVSTLLMLRNPSWSTSRRRLRRPGPIVISLVPIWAIKICVSQRKDLLVAQPLVTAYSVYKARRQIQSGLRIQKKFCVRHLRDCDDVDLLKSMEMHLMWQCCLIP